MSIVDPVVKFFYQNPQVYTEANKRKTFYRTQRICHARHKDKTRSVFKATSLFSRELNIGGNFYSPFNLSLTLFLSKNIWYILLAHPGLKPL